MDDSLDARSEAIARSRTYHLLGSLFLRGVTPATLPIVRTLDEVSDAVDVFRRGGDEVDFDEAAADHQHVFGFNVFGFEGVFLDETAQVGGATTRTVLDAYRRGQFPVAPRAESPDHIGVELNFLGFMCRRQADAEPEAAATLGRQIAAFIDEHLGRWLPLFAHAVEHQEHPFFTAVARLTLEFVENHRDALDVPTTSAFALPDAPDLLDDPGTSLRDIGRYLLTPAFSGLYLSRDDIRALSLEDRLPAGFGARRTMMNNLLRSAADYDRFQDVFKALLEHHAETRDHLDGLSRRSVWWQMLMVPWLGRLDRTEEVLRKIRNVAATAEVADPREANRSRHEIGEAP